MATNGIEAFLQAEEEAHRLVEELARLKEEADSYKTARQALDQAAEAVRGVATQLREIAGQHGDVVKTLREIGTPQLLQAQREVTSELALLRQDLAGMQQSVTEVLEQAAGQVRALKEDLGAQVAGAKAAVTTVRNLALGSIGLSLIALALLGWLVLTLARG